MEREFKYTLIAVQLNVVADARDQVLVKDAA